MNKKKLLLAATVTSALIAIALPAASANTLVLDYGSRHSGSGGEFNASSATLIPMAMGYNSAATATVNGNFGFETFCVEENEYFTPGNTYNYNITQAAISGGIAGGHPDPISKGTAWLYLKFAQKKLSGYDYSTGSGGNASAALLQETIWFLENETTVAPTNPLFLNLAMAVPHYLDNNAGFYRVGVLNLTELAGGEAQDQLTLLPTLVPDGGTTVILLGLALVGLFAAGRKLRLLKA
jgi:hypothetical protein